MSRSTRGEAQSTMPTIWTPAELWARCAMFLNTRSLAALIFTGSPRESLPICTCRSTRYCFNSALQTSFAQSLAWAASPRPTRHPTASEAA